MASNYYWLPKFDPHAAYQVAAWPSGHTVNGVQPKTGQPFDKASVSPRILEELYVKRWIAVADVVVPTAVAQVLGERECYASGGSFAAESAGRPIQELLTSCDYPIPVKRKRGRPRKNAAA